jgi:hypothetical protein
MIKFAIVTDRFQFSRKKYSSVQDAWFDRDDTDSRHIGIYDTIEEAREILKSISVSTRTRYGSYYNVYAEVAMIEEADFEKNEDGEWEFISGSNYYDFKCEELEDDNA